MDTEKAKGTALGAFVIGYTIGPLVLTVIGAMDEALWIEILVGAARFAVAYSVFLTWVQVRIE